MWWNPATVFVFLGVLISLFFETLKYPTHVWYLRGELKNLGTIKSGLVNRTSRSSKAMDQNRRENSGAPFPPDKLG
jgi:hypothetical protein